MKEDAQTGFFGFESFKDFWESFLGLKHYIVNILVAMIGGITSFITDYMWDDANAVWTLWILMGADWGTGLLKGMVNKRFVSCKIFRMPLYFVATSFVLSMSWNMAKGNVLFTPLPGIVMAGFYAVYFTSLLENLGELKVFPKVLVNVLKKRFGLKKVIDKYFEEDKDENKQP